MKTPRLTSNVLRVLSHLATDASIDGLSGAALRDKTRLATGTVYPLLFRLNDAGWVTSRWEKIDPVSAGRPRQRLYKITGLGMEQLASPLAAELRGLVMP